MPRLPGRDDEHDPVTIELVDPVTVRARGQGQDGVTELVLAHSQVSGPPVRFVSNRRYLARFLQLGFRELQVINPEKPLLARQPDRLYVWMLLNNASALPDTPDALRISSQDSHTTSVADPIKGISPNQQGIAPVSEPPLNGVNHNHRYSRRNTPMPTPDPKQPVAPEVGDLLDPITEVEKLRSHLQESLASTNRLIVALKNQRRQSRAMSAAMASLRRLQQFGS